MLERFNNLPSTSPKHTFSSLVLKEYKMICMQNHHISESEKMQEDWAERHLADYPQLRMMAVINVMQAVFANN